MRIAELVMQCKRQIESNSAFMTLVVTGPPPRGEKVRLDRKTRRKCPMGEVLCYTEERGTVASFDPIEVLAWLVSIGAVQVAKGDEEAK